jgi:peptidoglycan/LPS O-acetylase OafA/YrhL
LVAIFTLTAGRRSPAFVQWFSDVTYPIYLFHLFFLFLAQDHFPHRKKELALDAVLVPWAAGLLGSLLVIAVGRKLLGRTSRTILGA